MSRARGPLRPHPRNPRYFDDGTGRAVYLVGSHTWANFLTDQGDTEFEFERYLDWLVAHGHNAIRGWNWDLPLSDQGPNGGPFRFGPQAWKRTGPGLAGDGLPRFDLASWNDEFFDRLHDRAARAGDRGIYVAVMLFQGFAWQFDRRPDDGQPWDGRNNINGVDGGPGWGASTLEHPEVVAFQDAYVRRMVETASDLPNVLWEVANEAVPSSAAWQYHHLRNLHALERDGMRHPAGMTFCFEGGTLEALTGSPADWISPDSDATTRADPPPTDGSQIVIYDSDHGFDWRSLRSVGPDGWRRWVWSCFTRGAHVWFMDPHLARIEIDGEVRNAPIGRDPRDPRFGLEPDPFWDPMRRALGDARALADRIDLAAMTPRPDLCSTRFCLADPGAEYVALTDLGEPVELRTPPGRFDVEWLDAASGVWTTAGSVSFVEEVTSLRPPIGSAAVLHLRRS